MLVNAEAARKYALCAMKYADELGETERHRQLATAVLAIDDAKDGLR